VKTIGNGVLAVQADVAKLADVDKLYARFEETGEIDVLFGTRESRSCAICRTSERLYDEQFTSTSKAAYFTIQKALPRLTTERPSFEHERGDRKAPRVQCVLGHEGRTALLGENTARGTSGRGIRVNTVAPDHCHAIFGRTVFEEASMNSLGKSLRKCR